MSEVKKIATRDSYGNALVELGKAHDDLIVLDADLAGATKTCIFQKEFPERHCGRPGYQSLRIRKQEGERTFVRHLRIPGEKENGLVTGTGKIGSIHN